MGLPAPPFSWSGDQAGETASKKTSEAFRRRLLGGSAPGEAISLTEGLPHLGEQVVRQGSGFSGQVEARGNKVSGENSLYRCSGDGRVAFVSALEVVEG